MRKDNSNVLRIVIGVHRDSGTVLSTLAVLCRFLHKQVYILRAAQSYGLFTIAILCEEP